MRFLYEEDGFQEKVSVSYVESDYAFSTTTSDWGDISVQLADVSIGFDSSTMRAISIYGFCPKRSWKKKDFNLPVNTLKGSVVIEDKSVGERGGGFSYRYKEVGRWRETSYYNEEKKIVCIGELEREEKDVYVSFLHNAIIALTNHEVKAVYIDLGSPSQ